MLFPSQLFLPSAVYKVESLKGLRLTQRVRIAFENTTAVLLNAVLSHSWDEMIKILPCYF